MARSDEAIAERRIPTGWAMALGACAGALGWGIRGQFGGETGAMVPGAMLGLCAALLIPRRPSATKAIALGAVGALGFSIGGSMTYGQTLGLMQNEPHPPTYWWGFLGLVLKGGVWFGLGGLLVGLAASEREYAPLMIELMVVGACFAFFAGLMTVNAPYEPPGKVPAIYFSDPINEPRREVWAGLWFAFLWLAFWARQARDHGVLRFAGIGLLGGAIGFPAGEMIQAWAAHAHPLGEWGQRWVDWWKVMECTFGAIGGAAIAFAAVRSRAGQPRRKLPDRRRTGYLLAGLTCVWAIAVLVADSDAWSAEWLTIPFIGGCVPLLACLFEARHPGSRGRAASLSVVVFLVFALSALNAIAHVWEATDLMAAPGGVWLVLALVGLLSAMLGAIAVMVVRRHGSPAAWLLGFVAVSQTAWTWVKSAAGGFLEADLWQGFSGGAGIVVESVFIVLMALVLALAWRIRRVPDSETTTHSPRQRL